MNLKQEYKILKEELYNARGYKESLKDNDNLHTPLTTKNIKKMQEGEGDELSWKFKQVNSSAALFINVFDAILNAPIIINGIGKFNDYEVEKKLKILKNSKMDAHLDGYLENEDIYLFIESKFTEYLNNQKGYSKLASVYNDVKRYYYDEIYNDIIKLWFDEKSDFPKTFAYFDGWQILRHIIAIYNDVRDNTSKYKNKKVILMNLVWEIKNSKGKFFGLNNLFINFLKEFSEFNVKIERYVKECFKRYKVDFEFVYMSYYDFVVGVSNIRTIDEVRYEYLMKRYFFLNVVKEDLSEDLFRNTLLNK